MDAHYQGRGSDPVGIVRTLAREGRTDGAHCQLSRYVHMCFTT